MPLEAGARFGPFEIVSPAGAGGMGEVYRARDTRLDRTVAVKVLPADLTSDPAARQRFEREARAVAALSHPHICTLHDIGQQDGADFLVMEYLEGQTLAARLTRGKLPLDQALQYGIQIADALAAAHRAGIIHRDLKPGNVMITKAGAKLLDFGLAKPRTQAIVSGQTVTSAQPLTGKGTILGTLQYMAPEQLEGKEADPRSDIFAFGAVLYELATGQKAHTGPSHAGIVGDTRDGAAAPVSSVRPVLPAALDRAIQKCLASDPEHRWQHAADLRDELQWIAQQSSQEGVPVQVGRRWKTIALLSAALASSLLAVLVALAIVHFSERPPSQSRVAFTVQRPLNTTFPLLNMPVLSPDGTRLLFVAPGQGGGKLILWNRALDSLAPQPIAGTEISSSPPLPFWSPDGRSIGFFADGKLKTIAASGGAAQTLADAPDGWGGSWGPDGTIIFSPRTGPLYRVSAAGGPATPLRELDAAQREVSQLWPYFLPDGKHYLYVARSTDADKTGICLGTIGAQESRLLIRGESNVAYSPPGYLIFVRDGTLLAQAFDLGSLQLANAAVPLPGHGGESAPALGWPYGLFSVSGNGILAYAAGGYANAQPTWYDRTGKVLGAIGEPAEYGTVTLSPDDKRVALERTGAAAGVWLIELATGVATRLTFKGSESDPIWAPDGRELVFLDYRSNNLRRKMIGNSEDELLLSCSGDACYGQESAHDGASILFINQDGRSLYRLPLSGSRTPELLLETPFPKDQFRVSPDGRWIAFNSLESGRWEVYVASFPSFADKRQVSRGGGGQPLWRKDGKELFYLGLDGNLMAVPTTTGAAFDAGAPAGLFRAPIRVDPLIDQYGVTQDGQRFIFAPFDSAVPITVLVNWAAGLNTTHTAARAPQ
jgi:eukaryotic-like serine/threonine-protein kinase